MLLLEKSVKTVEAGALLSYTGCIELLQPGFGVQLSPMMVKSSNLLGVSLQF